MIMEIYEAECVVQGLIGEREVSRISYRTIGYKAKSLYIESIYTMEAERGKGHASQLLEYLVKKYGDKMDIKLSCCPYGCGFAISEFGKKYKPLQEKAAKWYEKFGFATIKKEEYDDSYEWKMIRKKNNII
jgi:GNAT superfamily N-acetyltransferase